MKHYTITSYGCAEYLRHHGFTIEGEIVFNRPRVPVATIQREVAKHFNLPLSVMKLRGTSHARPRQVAMYLCREYTPRSLPEIGRLFGGRDHSTVLHGVRTIKKLRETDPDINAAVSALQSSLEAA